MPPRRLVKMGARCIEPSPKILHKNEGIVIVVFIVVLVCLCKSLVTKAR